MTNLYRFSLAALLAAAAAPAIAANTAADNSADGVELADATDVIIVTGQREAQRAAREVADRKAINQALTRTENNISSAAKLLGISRPTLYDLIKQYQLHA